MNTPVTHGGERRLLAILTVIAVTVALFLAFTGTARAGEQHHSTSSTSTSLATSTSGDTEGTTVSTEATTSSTTTQQVTTTGGTGETTVDTGPTSTEGQTSSTPGVSETTVSTDPTSSVLGTVVTTAPETGPDDELPFTGLDAGTLMGVVVVLVGLGVGVLAMTRRPQED
jgi:hypothetical protein